MSDPVLSASDLTSGADIVALCRELAAVTDMPWGTVRTFLSPAMRQANDTVAGWMREVGLSVSMDAAGNLRGVRYAQQPGAKTVVLASHLDTVPDAGAFDGVLGVVLSIAVAEHLRDEPLPFHLEVIGFSEEEGVRFSLPFIGSHALVGTLDDAALQKTDAAGVSVRDAIRSYGLDPAQLPAAVLKRPLAYLEFHIEQGPELDSEGLPLGVVETVAGQTRCLLTFTGEAQHAGTTPMRLRHDALAAAAEWIAEVERYARVTANVVATCGSLQVKPGAVNVIAGEVQATLDVRSPNDAAREDAVRHLLDAAQRSGAARGVAVQTELRMQQAAVPLDRGLLTVLEDAVDSVGAPIRRMNSGAGHDAMVVAPHMPAAMLFLRTPGGLSHHPAETVLPGDVDLALAAGVAFVRALAAKEVSR